MDRLSVPQSYNGHGFEKGAGPKILKATGMSPLAALSHINDFSRNHPFRSIRRNVFMFYVFTMFLKRIISFASDKNLI